MNNISLHGVNSPLNNALSKNFKFTLSLAEIKEVHKIINAQNKKTTLKI